MYAAVDAPLIRISTQRHLVNWSDWPDLTSDSSDLDAWRDWLSRAWADSAYAAGTEFASPDLAARVRTVLDGRETRPRQVRRAVESALRYLLRGRGRATPFGLFAGVAPIAVADDVALSVGTNHRVMARVDALWLQDFVRQLEREESLRDRLMVQSASARISRDGYFVFGWRTETTSSDEDTTPADVAIRETAASQAIMDVARTPNRYRDLVDTLAVKFPNKGATAIRHVLGELLDQRILISNLRPPMTATDPLAHVVDVLVKARAAELPTVAPLMRILTDVHHRLAAHNKTTDSALANIMRRDVVRVMRDLAPGAAPLALDQRADITAALPRIVFDTAARAANTLRRLAADRHGGSRWADYHRRFLERYGPGATVPVQDVLDSDSGLGFPAGYRSSLLAAPTSPLSDRDSVLLRLAQNAALERTIEVKLDDATITALEVPDILNAQHSPHAELVVRLHAPNLSSITDGRFDLVVTATFRAAGATTGRMLDMLDPADFDRFTRTYRGLPTANDGARRVQLSCPPLYASTEDVARSPQILDELVTIDEHHPDSTTIRLDDLAVRGDAHRLYLWSISRSEPVEPQLFSGVELTRHVPPILWFLCEISGALTVHPGTFAWGAAAKLPFLPRLRHGQVILCPARWSLTASDLPGAHESWPQWSAALSRWQEQMMAPRHLDVGDTDQRLRLDLAVPAHRHLLRVHLRRHEQVTVHEAPSPTDLGWTGGQAHEIIVPVANRSPAAWPPLADTQASAVTTLREAHLPGAGSWLMAKLYGHPDRHSAILARLAELFEGPDTPPPHWWLPYRDPDHHLRLRIHVPTAAEASLAFHRIGAWADDLRQLGLLRDLMLDTYRPEIGRYGSDAAMAAAEAVFVADSAAAVHHRRMNPRHDEARALIAASMLDIAAAFTGNADAGRQWLIAHNIDRSGDPIDRRLYYRALEVADPRDSHFAVRALRGGTLLLDRWSERRMALLAYRDALNTTIDSPSTDSALGALLHLHSIRLLGIDRRSEHLCRRLARAAALSQNARAHAMVSS